MRPLSGPKCPTCQGDFVEEILPGSDNPEDYFIQEDQPEEQSVPMDASQPQAQQNNNGGQQQQQNPFNVVDPFQNIVNSLQNLFQMHGQQQANGVPMQNQPMGFVWPMNQNPIAFNPAAQQNAAPNNNNNNNPNGQPQQPMPLPGIFQIQIQDGRGPPRIIQVPANNLFGAFGIGGGNNNLPGNLADYGFGRSMQDIITQIMNQSQYRGAPPASKKVVENLPKVKVTKEAVEKKTQCSVCMVDLEENEEVMKLPCEHVFHDGCIKPWLEIHNSCPVCRFELPTDDADYENRRQQQKNSTSNQAGATNSNPS
jgi:hypothetical protein